MTGLAVHHPHGLLWIMSNILDVFFVYLFILWYPKLSPRLKVRPHQCRAEQELCCVGAWRQCLHPSVLSPSCLLADYGVVSLTAPFPKF